MTNRAMLALLAPMLTTSAIFAAEAPRINLETLDRAHPGWTMVEQSGDASSGAITAERIVWPMFYLRWVPIEDTGGTLSPKEAEKIVSGLWEGLVLDTPPEAKKVTLPQHEGFLIETTTSHGEMKNRYHVWACPQSGRVVVTDAALNTTVNAPTELQGWTTDMVSTVRCHPDAAVTEYRHLRRQYEVPGGEISYSMPQLWTAVEGYRVQKVFGGIDLAATSPASTPKDGQDLALASDALLRLYVTWRPITTDFPMSYDVLRQETEDFFKQRSSNMMINETRVSRDVWILEGRLRPPPLMTKVPPARDHLFRTWVWRKDSTLYLVAGTVGGLKFGRRILAQPLPAWNGVLEGMFQSILY